MPITVSWYDENERIVLEHVAGDFTLDEFFIMADECEELCMQKDYTVDVILDMTDSGRAPRNPMAGVRYARKKMTPNQRMVIFVNPDTFVRTLIRMSERMRITSSDQIKIAHSVSEALGLIDEANIHQDNANQITS